MRENEDVRNYYDIITKIGEDGFGAVYKAKIKNMEEYRAIKIIEKNKIINSFMIENLRKPNEKELTEYKDGFLKEIENMKLIEGKNKENQNTVKFYEYFNNEKEFCIVMELCDGDLFELLSNKKDNQGFNIDEIYDILNQLNNTFKKMDENKLVHRDLKLPNILFKYINKEKNYYIVKLSDYGISKVLFTLTKKLSTQIGTSNMMAPEILKGNHYDAKCDLWSLGIIIYLLYFHKYPYNGESEFAILNQIRNLRQKIIKKTENPELDNLILSLLNPDPDKRITWKQYFEHPFFKNKKRRTESISIKKPENIKDKISCIKVDKKEEIKLYLNKYKSKSKSKYIKAILLGSHEVGKTDLIRQFTHEEYQKIPITFCKTLEFPELGISLEFDIWDITCKKSYKKLIENFIEDTEVIIFIYDITNRKSFEEIKFFWYSLYKESQSKTKPILAVVANKEELYFNEQVS